MATTPGLDRITFDPNVMGGRACLRGMRIPVSLVLKLLADRMTPEEIREQYPDLEPEDIIQSKVAPPKVVSIGEEPLGVVHIKFTIPRGEERDEEEARLKAEAIEVDRREAHPRRVKDDAGDGRAEEYRRDVPPRERPPAEEAGGDDGGEQQHRRHARLARDPPEVAVEGEAADGDEDGGESYLVARNGRRLVLRDTRAAVSRALARSRIGLASERPYLTIPA